MRLLPALIALGAAAFPITAAAAGFATYKPATVSAPVSVPGKPACTLTLFRDRAFVGDAPLMVPYTPACRGPWSKVVLRLDTRIKGTQYDRIGALWIDRAEFLRFSTAEPTKRGIAYSVERDVTAYSALLRAPGFATVELANYVSKKYDGVYYLTASLSFYRSPRSSAAHLPDRVIPLDDELSATPWSNSGQLRERLTGLPRNVVHARLDLFVTNHGCDEFWYTNVPDAYAAAHKSDGLCGGGTYREVDVAIDGRPAFVVYPFPYIWTGGINPLLWRPLSALDTLAVPPYEVDLDPWAGVLSDGKPHTFSVHVFGSRGSWPVDGTLLLWRDARSAQTSGAISHDDFEVPAILTASRLNASGGTFMQTALASWQVTGYVDSSSGREWHAVDTQMHFENRQRLDLPAGAQDASAETTVNTIFIDRDRTGTRKRTVLQRFPLTANSVYPPPSRMKPYALVIEAHVRQGRIVKAPDLRCNAQADASAVLKRRPDGTDAVARGETLETNRCRGERNFSITARAKDGVLVRP